MKKWTKIAFPLLTLLMLIFIFSNSLRPAVQSAQQSGNVGGLVQWINQTFHFTLPVDDHLIRKTAHFCEFAALGLLGTASLFVLANRKTRNILGWILFAGLASAVTDETLQLFSAGRAAMVQDVLLDFAGFCTGFAVFFLIRFLFFRRPKRKKSGK